MQFDFKKKAIYIVLILSLLCFTSCHKRKNEIKHFKASSEISFTEKRNENEKNEITSYSKYGYRIEYGFSLIENNSVGNQWQKYVYINEQKVESGGRITANCGESVTIKVVIIENDKIPDKSSCIVNIKLEDGEKETKQIIVRENRGQYSGNTAIWEFGCQIVAI